MADRTASTVSSFAAEGFRRGGDSYDKFRPGYTSHTVRLVADEVIKIRTTRAALGRNSEDCPKLAYNVAELGAGTGKFTELLVKTLPDDVRYLAVEPSEDFCGVLKAKELNVETVVGAAAAIPAPDASVENIICAEAFHWFADADHLKEMRRVLVPGGNLIIVFNFRDYSKDWMQKFYAQRVRLTEKIGDSLKHIVFSMEWQQDLNQSTLFAKGPESSLPGFPMSGTVEKILEHTKTQQCYKNLPEDELLEVLDELRQTLQTWPGLNLESIVYPFISKVYVYTAV